ncbi:IS5 family transposase [Gemmata sp. JC673]|uniref:IS5 family transposase n=1 Tax=Gemmata algarum TaxID=2975278 RepID=A0ABU5EWF6_9BACT|nr:IS5 family transposase [Gemmata algarum]MDY3559294.1 IS5 family transposase [Gemmata algarum]
MPDANTSARKSYSSDLTADQWAILEPMFPPNTGRGRRQTIPIKEIIDAVFYINASGCTWADLPHDFPPPSSVSYHYTKWVKNGTWRRINDALREAVRVQAGRDPHPSAGALDSQTIKAAPTGGHRGYDGGKGINGRKRHILVDTLGLVIAVTVTAASASDAAGAIGVLRQVSRFEQPRLRTIFVDQAYHRGEVYTFADQHLSCTVHVGNRPPGAQGFVPIRKRWVVERTFGWLIQSRRHAKDYERTFASSESQLYITHVRILLRRLTKSTKPTDSGPASIAANHSLAA